MRKELQDKLDAIRKQQNMVAASDFLQVGMSDLYDFNMGLRATLKEIAFMQATKENPNYLKDSPFKDDQIGWCYASQAYLAKRVGGSERQVRRHIAQLEEDGVIKVREWTDSNGYPHCEYHVNEDVVQAHQRPDDKEAPRPKRSGREYRANKGSFSKENQPLSHRTSQPQPRDMSAVGRRTAQPLSRRTSQTSATAEMTVKGVVSRGLPLSSFDEDDEQFVPASPELDAAAALVDGEEPRTAQSLGARQDQKQTRPVGTITKGERKPLPNRLCYPELYAQWQKKRGRIPSCKRCKEILFWEEHHDCPGFREHEYGPILGPVAPKGAEVFDGPPRRKYLTTFDDCDDPEEDTLEGYEDFDDDHPAKEAMREEL
jgi:hypothetical protein